jgi:hypothetical protein
VGFANAADAKACSDLCASKPACGDATFRSSDKGCFMSVCLPISFLDRGLFTNTWCSQISLDQTTKVLLCLELLYLPSSNPMTMIYLTSTSRTAWESTTRLPLGVVDWVDQATRSPITLELIPLFVRIKSLFGSFHHKQEPKRTLSLS